MGRPAPIEPSLIARGKQLARRIAHAREMGREGVQLDSDEWEIDVVRRMLVAFRARMKALNAREQRD